jgi:tetratricopeptide (TPR) repeat protein
MYHFTEKIFIFIIGLILIPGVVFAQSSRQKVLDGNKFFQEEKFDEANNKYRDALIDNPENPIINFNIGNTLYKKKKFEDALKDYEKSLSVDNILNQSQSYYNMGNSLYRMGKLPESILAYTQALKLNPNDEDAKYNLDFVRAKLKEQAQNQPQNNQQQQQQDQQQQGENQEQNKEEQQQDQKEEEQSEQQEQEQQQAEQQQPQEMSKEEAERILNALKEDEKDLQKEKKPAKSGKVRIVKDW